MRSKVAFLHVPKSAGSAVAEGLGRLPNRKTELALYDDILFGGFSDFASLDEITRSKMLHLSPGIVDPEWEIVSGHLSLPTIAQFFPEHRVFTVMREPRSRLLSLWLYLRSIRSESLVRWGTWANRIAGAYSSFGQFITEPMSAARTDNVMARMLLGHHPLIPGDDFIPTSADAIILKEARLALARIDFVGLNEDRDLGRRISDFLGDPYRLMETNVTEAPPPDRIAHLERELDASTIESIHARTRLDRELWDDHARAIFGSDVNARADSAFLGMIFRHMRKLSESITESPQL